MILSVKSWSPEEMKIFVPSMAYVPSPLGTARVLSKPKSVPAPDSVRHIVPVHSPLASLGAKRRRISGLALATTQRYAPSDKRGYNAQEILLPPSISPIMAEVTMGNSCPPSASLAHSPDHPPSIYC